MIAQRHLQLLLLLASPVSLSLGEHLMPPTDQIQKEQDSGLDTTTYHTIWTDDFLAVGPAMVRISGKTSTHEMDENLLVMAAALYVDTSTWFPGDASHHLGDRALSIAAAYAWSSLSLDVVSRTSTCVSELQLFRSSSLSSFLACNSQLRSAIRRHHPPHFLCGK